MQTCHLFLQNYITNQIPQFQSIHIRPLYLVCPDVLLTVDETSYWIRVGFIESDIVITITLII